MMKCYALAVRLVNDEINWSIPGHTFSLFNFFKTKTSEQFKQEISELLERTTQNARSHVEKKGYHYYAINVAGDSFAAVCDNVLSEIQIKYLVTHLLIIRIKPDAKAFEKYIQDHRVDEINTQLNELQNTMRANIDKVLERGNQIEILIESQTTLIEPK